MPAFEIEPLHRDFGAKLTGVDLNDALHDDAVVAAIKAAIDEYSFLCFPDQPFDDARQLAFTERLGPPEPSHVAAGEGKVEYFGTIGNVLTDGTVQGSAHKRTKFQTGNNMWHSDASFKPVPAMLSIMCAYETPDEGGETLFASGRAAYRRLQPAEQARLDPMIAVHDYVFSRSKVGADAVTPGLAATLPPVRQRLVRRNPATGAKNLFVGSHVREVEGMEAGESRALLDDLVARTTEPDCVLAHAWRPGDLVIWDNRCLVHRGAGFDADRYRRRMRQTRVSGAAPSLEE